VYFFVIACRAKQQFQRRRHRCAGAASSLRQIGGTNSVPIGFTVAQRNCGMALVGETIQAEFGNQPST